MDDAMTAAAQMTLDAAFAGTMDFPAIVSALIAAGFEGYHVDYRRGTSTYFCADGSCVELDKSERSASVAAAFDATEIERAVRAAQHKEVGYTYAGFNRRVQAAGCAGYIVSFLGKRVVYYGRTAETHVEHFPQ